MLFTVNSKSCPPFSCEKHKESMSHSEIMKRQSLILFMKSCSYRCGVTSPPMGGSDVTTHGNAKNEISDSDFDLKKN